MKISDCFVNQIETLSKVFSKNDVILFSEISLDKNPVHLDEEYAKDTIFKSNIVHGCLCASLISAVIGTKLPGPGAIYLHQELNFTKPVYFDEEVTAIVIVKEIKLEKSLLYLDTKCYKNGNEMVIDGKAIIKLV